MLRRENKKMILLIVCATIGMAIGGAFGVNAAMRSMSDDDAILVVGLVNLGGAIGAALGWVLFRIFNSAGLKSEKFVLDCARAGVFGMEGKVNLAKAKTIAEEIEIKDEEKMISLYNMGIESVTKDALDIYNDASPDRFYGLKFKTPKKQTRYNSAPAKMKEQYKLLYDIGRYLNARKPKDMAAVKNAEITQRQELDAFLSCRGREKRIAMLEAMLESAQGTYIKAKKSAKTVERGLIQREKDWAVAGGIASGIAGPAAGLSTALNVQRENAAIRQSNKEMTPVVMAFEQEAWNKEKRVEALKKSIVDTKTKLLGEANTQELFDQLSFSDITTSISETGTVTINLAVNSPTDMSIYDGEVEAVIDGFLVAELTDKSTGSMAGKANLTLPVNGIRGTNKLVGMCTDTIAPSASYDVKIQPNELWQIER